MGFVERFMSKISKQEGGCWLWTGATSKPNPRNGICYPRIRVDGVIVKAHRLAYKIFVGPIPPGMLVCHRCDVSLCVNPAHLFLGTHTDNNHDMHRKGRARFSYGERNGAAKLTADQVQAIRRLYVKRSREFGGPALSRMFGVDPCYITLICRGGAWK